MEEFLEMTRKQLRFQKIISALLAVIIVMLLVAGTMFVRQMNQMTTAMNEAVEKLQDIDVEGINDAISSTQAMLESVDEFSAAVDQVTERVKDFDTWMSGSIGKRARTAQRWVAFPFLLVIFADFLPRLVFLPEEVMPFLPWFADLPAGFAAFFATL